MGVWRFTVAMWRCGVMVVKIISLEYPLLSRWLTCGRWYPEDSTANLSNYRSVYSVNCGRKLSLQH